MQLKPLGDRVVIKVLTQEEKTKGGIVPPDTARKTTRRRSSRGRKWQGVENGQKFLEVKVGKG